MRIGAAGLLALALGAQAQQPLARTSTLVGELVRVDLERPAVTLKVVDGRPREYEIELDEATRFVSRGRVLQLADLRVGERAVAVVTEETSGRRRATLLKLGAGPYAAPRPEASKSPRP